jgi:CRP-like cAMP-binding protein
VSPGDRIPSDIDVILAVVGKWPIFAKYVRNEQERREICRRITLEQFRKNEIITKQGEEPDAWYLIFSGQCSLFMVSANRDEPSRSQVPLSTIAALRAAFGEDKSFIHVATKGPTEDFGVGSIFHSPPLNATVFADKPSLILRVDPIIYRETMAWIAKSQLEKKATILGQVSELSMLRESRDVLLRLAEFMEPCRFEIGTVIDVNYFQVEDENRAFFIVEDGALVKKRMVDFTGRHTSTSALSVHLPQGRMRVKVAVYGPGTMFPDPAMRSCVPYPFTMVVKEPVTAYRLRRTDLISMLLTVQTEKVMAAFQKEPNDEQMAQMWTEGKEAVKWKAYRRSCIKEARRGAKVERAVSCGAWATRKPDIPKPIKDHRPFTPLLPKSYQAS